jgi:hypothetical protein
MFTHSYTTNRSLNYKPSYKYCRIMSEPNVVDTSCMYCRIISEIKIADTLYKLQDGEWTKNSWHTLYMLQDHEWTKHSLHNSVQLQSKSTYGLYPRLSCRTNKALNYKAHCTNSSFLTDSLITDKLSRYSDKTKGLQDWGFRSWSWSWSSSCGRQSVDQ